MISLRIEDLLLDYAKDCPMTVRHPHPELSAHRLRKRGTSLGRERVLPSGSAALGTSRACLGRVHQVEARGGERHDPSLEQCARL
jgi:hypothetical protein